MILNNYTAARDRFFSPIESIGRLSITGPDVNSNMAIKLRDIKGLLSYFSVVHAREPIMTDAIELLKPITRNTQETLDYNAFIETTKINNSKSFYFQATTFVHKAPLSFIDVSLFGQKNIYKPFDSNETRVVDSMLTATIGEVRKHSDDTFKFKHFRGTIAFERASIHRKGYTIKLEDKNMFLTIIATRHNFKSGISSYIGILYTVEV